jgi:hypothetical protein
MAIAEADGAGDTLGFLTSLGDKYPGYLSRFLASVVRVYSVDHDLLIVFISLNRQFMLQSNSHSGTRTKQEKAISLATLAETFGISLSVMRLAWSRTRNPSLVAPI